MKSDEMLGLVKEIYFGPAENARITPLLDRLYKAFPHAHISDLIFNNPVELTPEQVVDEALKREAEYAARSGKA